MIKIYKYMWIFIALSGALAVAMGAISAHALQDVLMEKDIMRIQTGATYQMYHTLALMALCVHYQRKPLKLVHQSCMLFVMGIVLFSGGLYIYAMSHIKIFATITPIGGVLFILAWLNLIRVLRSR